MTDGFVQQNPRPARAKHHVHSPRRGVFSAQIQHRLTHRFAGVAFIISSVDKEAELHPPAAAETADLPIAVFLDNTSNIEARKRLDIANHQALRRSDQDYFVFRAIDAKTFLPEASKARVNLSIS